MSRNTLLDWASEAKEYMTTDTTETSASQSSASVSETSTDIDFNQTFSMPSAGTSEEYAILPPGTYPARITGITRSVHEPRPGGKYPRCGRVDVIFEVHSDDGKTASCRKSYYLVSDKIAVSQMYFLFKATDLLNADGSFGNRWDDLVNKYVDVTVGDSTSEATGKIYHNQVTRVMPPSVTDDDLPF